YDLVSPRVVVGRVALLGDAAFVARPHVGAGGTKAALDALGMAEAISDTGGDLTAGLARYDRERRLLRNWLVAPRPPTGALTKSRPKGEHTPTTAELDRRAEIIMRDYIAVAADIEDLTTQRP